MQARTLPIKAFLSLTLLACLASCLAAHADTPAPISAAALRADAAFIRATIARMHPDQTFSTDPDALARALDTVAADAPAEMTRDEAWRRLSLSNPVLGDGHLFVGLEDWRKESADYLAAGGGFFPFEVDVDEGGTAFIHAALGGEAGELDGARILAIDGVPVASVTAELLKHVHGDTPRFRAALLSRRWWLYHWKVAGAAMRYRLDLARDGRRWSVDVAASRHMPAVLRDDADFTRQFDFTIKAGCAAVLKVGSFDPAFKDRFLAFTRAAFARMREQRVDTLVIDVSANGGGDDDVWLEGLMPYLAKRPYRTGSTYLKRVLKADPARGEAAGQVVAGEIETWRAPQPDNPLLFNGKVFVAIGPHSYSSTVLFANVMQDFGFAAITGTGNAARRTQSGGIQRFRLPDTGLALWVPRFILAPPGHAPRDALLNPGASPAPACL
jgi:hypothetical protein